MGARTYPGIYNYYRRPLPDEPIFVLLARDPAAPDAIESWALHRGTHRPGADDAEMIGEALACADAMRHWRVTNDGAWRNPAPEQVWARVEVFGHRRHFGRVSEEDRFGARLLRIDVPTTDPAAFRTHYYAGSAVFSVAFRSEEECRLEENAELLPAIAETIADAALA